MKTTSHSKPFDCIWKTRRNFTKKTEKWYSNIHLLIVYCFQTKTILKVIQERRTWWMVVKVTEFLLSRRRVQKFAFSLSDIWSTKAFRALRHPGSLSTVSLFPSSTVKWLDKKLETSSSKYWRTFKNKKCNGKEQFFRTHRSCSSKVINGIEQIKAKKKNYGKGLQLAKLVCIFSHLKCESFPYLKLATNMS